MNKIWRWFAIQMKWQMVILESLWARAMAPSRIVVMSPRAAKGSPSLARIHASYTCPDGRYLLILGMRE
jgi:hypothetical protein